jgi:hypothetical protein
LKISKNGYASKFRRKTKSGKITRVTLPVEVWQKNKVWSFKHNSTEEIASITLDPDHVLPDSNTANNVER